MVIIKTRSDCKYCKDAKDFLTGMEIQYTEEFQSEGKVPQIFVDGKHIGGYDDLVKYSMINEIC
jgi:glutaredoxin